MEIVLKVLLLGLYSIAEPLRLVGYLAVGVVARRAGHAVLGGAAWAAIATVGAVVMGTGFGFDAVTLLIHVVSGAAAALVIHLVARALRRR